MAMAVLAHTQTASPPARNSVPNDKPTQSTPAPTVPASVAPVPAEAPPPAPLTAEQTPPQAPVVSWDGSLLTIDAENSTLAEILTALRSRTGASMEIPSAAYRERVFVHLGPGPIRDVISSLLYGTEFDYIVETSDDDPDALRSVVVTARGKGGDSAVGSLADVLATESAGSGLGSGSAGNGSRGTTTRDKGGRRLMPGWAAPGKPAFQADAEAALAAEEAARESGLASDTPDTNAQTPPSAPTESASVGPEASSTDPQPTSSAATPAANGVSVTETDLPPGTTQAASSSEADSSDQTGVSHMIQDMTRMFEQRRQIQVQQNQAAQQQQAPAD